MEVSDLPFGIRFAQLVLDPIELRGIHVVAVENEKLDFALLERIVTLAVHVEWLVKNFVGVVVVPEAGIELYSCIEHRLVRLFELTVKVAGLVATVDVVTHHDHEVETDSFPVCFHLGSDFVLGGIASAVIANDCEAGRFLLQRQLEFKMCLSSGWRLLKHWRKYRVPARHEGPGANGNQSCEKSFTDHWLSGVIMSGIRSTIRLAAMSRSTN